MAHKRYIRPMNMLDAVTASITDPYGTMEHLLVERPVPPYLIASLCLLFVVVVLPSVFYQYWYDIVPYAPQVAYATIVALSITMLFFILFVTITLRLLGISAPIIKILAVAMYSLTPLIPLMLGYYAGNVMTIGRLTVLTFFVTGRRVQGDWFIAFLPYFIKAAIVFGFLVFSQGIRVIGKMGKMTGVLTTILAIPLLAGAFMVGITCSEAIFPETAIQITKYLTGLLRVEGS